MPLISACGGCPGEAKTLCHREGPEMEMSPLISGGMEPGGERKRNGKSAAGGKRSFSPGTIRRGDPHPGTELSVLITSGSVLRGREKPADLNSAGFSLRPIPAHPAGASPQSEPGLFCDSAFHALPPLARCAERSSWPQGLRRLERRPRDSPIERVAVSFSARKGRRRRSGTRVWTAWTIARGSCPKRA